MIRGYQPFNVVGIESSEFDIQFDRTTEAKSLHTLPLTISPRNGSGEVKGKILVKTDLPGEQTVELGAVYSMKVESN